jgi:hypothetical protein
LRKNTRRRELICFGCSLERSDPAGTTNLGWRPLPVGSPLNPGLHRSFSIYIMEQVLATRERREIPRHGNVRVTVTQTSDD